MPIISAALKEDLFLESLSKAFYRFVRKQGGRLLRDSGPSQLIV